MTQNRQTIVILCEDKQQYLFARYFLQKKGFTGQFVAKVCPSGKQSGEQHVRERYAAEVKGYRSQKNRKKICLVVVIDADTFTVTERIRQLEMTLQEKRQSKENITIFVPKRNIETWIHYLQSGESIDEIVAYRKLLNQGECKPFVEKLADQCVRGLPTNAPSSMHDACIELHRIIE
jgi:nitrogen regulatory protein PII